MTKILPHYNCLNGEHVFIPNRTVTNTRETWIESFVCTHCLVVVKKTEWEIHQQELSRIAAGMKDNDSLSTASENKPYIPTDYKEPLKEVAKTTTKSPNKSAAIKA